MTGASAIDTCFFCGHWAMWPSAGLCGGPAGHSAAERRMRVRGMAHLAPQQPPERAACNRHGICCRLGTHRGVRGTRATSLAVKMGSACSRTVYVCLTLDYGRCCY